MSDKYRGTYPRAWSQSDIATYEETGREPPKTRNGLWVTDLEREAKDLMDWSLAELYALACGELYTTQSSGTGEFYKALRARAVLSDREAVNWGEEDLDEWLLFDKTPAKTPSGHYINDPDRWVKDATLWNDSELSDLGAGYFGELDRSNYYILDEASARFDLPVGITFEEFCTYIQNGQLPATTSNGILVNDRRRGGKEVTDYTDDEIEAWVLGEITLPETQLMRLLERSIVQFGGGRYWTFDQLKRYVVDNELPVLDYTVFSDEQLEILANQDNDAQAAAELLARHPVVEPEPEPEEPVDETDEEVVHVPESGGESPDEPESDLVQESGGVRQDDGTEEGGVEEDPAPEPAPQMAWTDLVSEGSPIYDVMVARTSDVVIADNERRRLLSASKWTLEELIAWARGEISGGLNTTDETLVAALRMLLGDFVKNWTNDAVKAFVASKELPRGIETGVLVEDIIRDRKHPGDWRDEDLRAWAAGNISTLANPERILLAARVRFNIPDRLSDKEAKEYIVTGKLPDDTVPPIEPGKPVSRRQLDAWLNGKLSVAASEEERLYIQARQTYNIDVHWTDAHIVSFIRNGAMPKRLGDGTLIEDRMRDPDNFSNWTWKELRALANGDIDASFSIDEACSRIRRLIDVQFGVNPAHWSNDEVIEYLKTNAKPKALEDGVHLNDPTRAMKQPVEWRDAELKAWLRGDISATTIATEDQLWDEVYYRFKVPMVWYREDAKSYVLNGVTVPATPSGIYVRDRNRDARPLKHWTRREIKAWARGQILPGLDTSPEAMVRRAAELFGISTLLDAESVKKRISSITEESMTMTVKFVTEDLTAYEAGRKEAGDNLNAAAPFQSMLDRCINRVMRLEGEDFVQGWTELLNFFYKNSNGICSAKKIYTGVGQMTITPKGLRNFQNMTTILLQTCNPATRDRSVKLIDWTAALKEVANEKSRQQLLAYYGIH